MISRSLLRYGPLLLLLCWLPACSYFGSSDSDLLFQEQFAPTQITNWLLEGDAQGRTLIMNEQLVIQVDATNTMQYATLSEPTFSDFVLEVEARLLSGPEESSYGVLFRQDEEGRFYRFQITGTGLYILERRNEDGSWTRLTEGWTASEAIKQGENVVNRLRVEAVGSWLAVYANDELLREVNDTAYVSGTIALDAGTFGRPGVQVAFDNITVRQP
ncbi:MAG: family 16 glycoside hydrolase [Chloroflexota bacterium]